MLCLSIRLKKVQEKKKKVRKEKEAAALELKMQGIQIEEAANLLNDDKDEDLLFND